MARGNCSVFRKRRSEILCLFSGIAMLLSFACLLIVLTCHDTKSEGAPGNQKPYLCVSCDELTQNGTIFDSDSLLAKLTKSKNSSNCCVDNSHQMSALLEWVSAEPISKIEPLPTFDPQNFTLSKASAHVRLLPAALNWDDEVEFPGHDLELGFRDKVLDKPHVQHKRNVKTGNGGVTVEIPGEYLIYSSIHFMPDSGEFCKDFKEQTWYLHVRRIRQDDPETAETLLSAAYTCPGESYRIHETIYTAGLFDLQANDQLRVYISGFGLLSYQVESSFMGVVMLGG